jgi:arsenite methyltransferase
MTNGAQSAEQLRTLVREYYAQAAAGTCCGANCCSTCTTEDLYSREELALLPAGVLPASYGCGNPVALAELQPGERVLDLGCGAGLDVLLAAQRVGPSSLVYGLDMTAAMLEVAERRRSQAGLTNVQWLQGLIEAVPLPAESVSVVISNCAINLVADKGQVLREAYRVLCAGGRLAITDIVFRGRFPEGLRHNAQAWVGCVAGALEEPVYRELLSAAGFQEIAIEAIGSYSLQGIAAQEGAAWLATLSSAESAALEQRWIRAAIRARKPGGSSALAS